ncbi:MAG: VWA domain-containing protein [Acidobacteriota bacterium]|nr:VWA domain-containing protein [Acidobacteriota bacterium]
MSSRLKTLMLKTAFRAASLAAVLATPVLLAGQQAPAAPAQGPTFRLEVNYVEVDAVVTDAQGHFVRGLTKNDFTVLENGKPQTISTFTPVDIPIETATQPLFATNPIPPDVQSNARPFNGRVYVMVLDGLHTKPERAGRVREVAAQFIRNDFGANDVMAILHIGGAASDSQDFTSNKQLLLDSVNKFTGLSARSRTADAIDDAFNFAGLSESTDPTMTSGEDVRSYNARVTAETLLNVVRWMNAIHGRRKALLFVSEGLDYDINSIFGDGFVSSVVDDVRQLISAASRADVNIYGIDPRGLATAGGDDIAVGSLPDSGTYGLGHGTMMDEMRIEENSLRVLSDETGGFPVLNQNDFQAAFRRIVADNSSYYVLGYYPSDETRDGKFRTLKVLVDRPGLVVRARKGYLAPKGKATPVDAPGPKAVSQPVRVALNSPLPVTGLTLHVFAAPFKGSKDKASVLLGVEASGRDLGFVDRQGRYDDSIEVAYQALDAKGKVQAGNRDVVNLALKPETRTLIQQTGIRVLNRLDLPPGRYQVRLAAREDGNGSVGSVRYDLEVPDFYKPLLSMSGIALTSASASRMVTARPDTFLKPPVMPAPPSAERAFPVGDTLALFAEVYDNDTKAPHTVDITTTVRTDTGTVVFKNEDQRNTSEFGGKRGGFGYASRIPLKGMAPGLYVLKVEARSELGKMPSVSREIQFTIRPDGGAVTPGR